MPNSKILAIWRYDMNWEAVGEMVPTKSRQQLQKFYEMHKKFIDDVIFVSGLFNKFLACQSPYTEEKRTRRRTANRRSAPDGQNPRRVKDLRWLKPVILPTFPMFSILKYLCTCRHENNLIAALQGIADDLPLFRTEWPVTKLFLKGRRLERKTIGNGTRRSSKATAIGSSLDSRDFIAKGVWTEGTISTGSSKLLSASLGGTERNGQLVGDCFWEVRLEKRCNLIEIWGLHEPSKFAILDSRRICMRLNHTM